MKKIIGTIAIIISFAILANSKVSASTIDTANANTYVLTKQELIQILEVNNEQNVNIDLKPISIAELIAQANVNVVQKTAKNTPIAKQQVNADE